MSKEKQIEEMAREMCHLSKECKTCQICDERYHGDGEPCYFQCVAKEIINHGYRKSEWISVEERLPEKHAYVIVCDEDGTVGEAFCYKEGGFEWMYSQEIAFVTHWMPLPEAPKMKGGEE